MKLAAVRLLRRSFVRTVVEGPPTSDQASINFDPGIRGDDASLRAEVSRGEAVTNLETNGGPVDSPFKITA